MTLAEMITDSGITPPAVDFENDPWETIAAAKVAINTYCNAVAEWCNEPVHSGKVQVSELIALLLASGITPQLHLLAGNTAASAEHRMAAIAALDLLSDRDGVVDYSNATQTAALNNTLGVLLDAGIVDADQKAQIMALGDNRVTRAAYNGRGAVTARDIYIQLTAARVAADNAARDEANKVSGN